MKLLQGNNLDLLKTLEDNSIDSIVTDPPYGLSFMGKKWDYDVPSIEFWQQVFRVLKPGGHVLSFGGTRTYHRMVVNIEDAGFEIRDQIQWIYGSGFPKSHNIGKAVDKLEGNDRKLVYKKEDAPGYRKNMEGTQPNTMSGKFTYNDVTKGNSPYEGWGTALKPANEPICVARKPLSEKTIAENVIKWGTGGINIDGCRIGYKDENDKKSAVPGGKVLYGSFVTSNESWGQQEKDLQDKREAHNEGRFPANIILDETAAELLDEQSGTLKSGIASMKNSKSSVYGGNSLQKSSTNFNYEYAGYTDTGGASRFFYQPKVSKAERNMGLDGFEEKETKVTNYHDFERLDGTYKSIPIHKNSHPTVKPINLMTYLCRLVTPANGIVLDPFMGSGSTGIAARLEGFDFIGMEMDEDYFNIAEARINNYENYRKFMNKK